MDRDYIEKHLSAYIDGELPESELSRFKKELQKYPDLVVQLERLKKLDKLAHQSEVEMPAEGYFDQMAAQIDRRISSGIVEEDTGQKRSIIQKIFSPNARVVSIVGSIAAVLLIAIVGQKMYRPAVDEFRPPVKPTPVEKALQQKLTSPASSLLTPKAASESLALPGSLERRDQERSVAVTHQEEFAESIVPVSKYNEIEIAPAEKKLPEAVPDELQVEAFKIVSQAALQEAVPIESLEGTSEPAKSKQMSDKETVTAGIESAGTGRLDKSDETRDNAVLKSDKGEAKKSLSRDRKDVHNLSAVQAEETSFLDAEQAAPDEFADDQSLNSYSESQLDSLIELYTSQKTEEGDKQAARLAFFKAKSYPGKDSINDARRRIEHYLNRSDAQQHRYWQSLLDKLAKIEESL